MEKIFQFIPGATQPTPDTPNQQDTGGEVQLRNRHLWIDAKVAENAFGNAQQVLAVYYDNLKTLILAPDTDATFKQAHECSMIMLKTKSAKGDKSLSLEEIIIDNELNDADRELVFVAAPGMQMLQVKF